MCRSAKIVKQSCYRKEAIEIYFSDKRDKEMFPPIRSNKNDAHSSTTLKFLGLALGSKESFLDFIKK